MGERLVPSGSEGTPPRRFNHFSLLFLGEPFPMSLTHVVPGVVPVPAALGRAPPPPPVIRKSSGSPVWPVGHVEGRRSARPAATVQSTRPVGSPALPKLGIHQAAYAASAVAKRISATQATAGRVAGAVFDDVLEDCGLPAPLAPQAAFPPLTTSAPVVKAAFSASVGDSRVPLGAAGSSAPTDTSNDSRLSGSSERKPIVSLDPGIEDEDDILYGDSGPLGPVVQIEGLSPLREEDMEF